MFKRSEEVLECVVEVLDNSKFQIDVPKNANGLALLSQTKRQLNLEEMDYFGLRYYDEKEQPVSLYILPSFFHACGALYSFHTYIDHRL
jgi:hypothetical protein